MLDLSKMELGNLRELGLSWNKNTFYTDILILFRAEWMKGVKKLAVEGNQIENKYGFIEKMMEEVE